MARRGSDERTGGTFGLDGFISAERARLLNKATPLEREQMAAAERSREVYAAWNAVVAGTQEGDHVTGLHYVPEKNELVVYLDSAAWSQNMTMAREIIRARMAVRGVDVAGFIFRTSREGYTAGRARGRGADTLPGTRSKKKTPAPRAPLSAEEERALDDSTAAVDDPRLRDALKKAMKASLEWKKGSNGPK